MTMMNNMFGFGFGGGIFMIVWWGIIIIVLVLLVRWLLQFSPPQRASQDALDVLKERYARGELSQEQFVKMRRELDG
jgi:putative membrane protein